MKKTIKNLLSIFSLIAITALTLSSCKKDDPNVADATLEIKVNGQDITSTGTYEAVKGGALNVTVTINGNADNLGKTIKITTDEPKNLANDVDLTTIGSNKNQNVMYYNFSPDAISSVKTVTFNVSVVTSGKTIAATKNFTIAVISRTKSSSTDIALGNQYQDGVRFWSSSEDKTYTIAELGTAGASKAKQGNVDICYVTRSSANGGNKITSPGSDDAVTIYGFKTSTNNTYQWTDQATAIDQWSTRNTTYFRVATAVSKSNITSITDGYYDNLIATEKATGDLTSSSLTALAVTADQVIFFKTSAGKYGFVVVSGANGSYTNADTHSAGFLTFKAYYQK